MTHRIESAPTRSVRRSLVTCLATGAFTVLAASIALAQHPAKPAKKPAAPAKPSAAAPAQPQAPAQAQNAPQLIYSPWTKICNKGKEANAKEVCFTGKDARTEAGNLVVAAALIEPAGGPKKILRITLPSPLQLQYGTRLIVDQGQPATSPFFTCFANGCMTDYEATPDLIGKMKKGHMLTVQAVNLAGNAINFPMPLAEFGKVNEGPPIDPKVFAAQQQKLQQELQRRAEEARKKLESQQSTAGKTH